MKAKLTYKANQAIHTLGEWNTPWILRMIAVLGILILSMWIV